MIFFLDLFSQNFLLKVPINKQLVEFNRCRAFCDHLNELWVLLLRSTIYILNIDITVFILMIIHFVLLCLNFLSKSVIMLVVQKFPLISFIKLIVQLENFSTGISE